MELDEDLAAAVVSPAVDDAVLRLHLALVSLGLDGAAGGVSQRQRDGGLKVAFELSPLHYAFSRAASGTLAPAIRKRDVR